MSLRCGKKRKLVVDHEAEKTLYSSFVSAANAVSQLYSQAVSQQRKASAQASRQALERVVAWLVAQNPGSDFVSKTAMLHFLQQEYESIEGGENLPHQFPAPQLSVVAPGAPGSDTDSQQGIPGKSARTGGCYGPSGVSPMRRQHSGGLDGMMDSSDAALPTQPQTQHQQQQQQHQPGAMPHGVGAYPGAMMQGFVPHMGQPHPA